jgi:hypothetical protein
MRDAYWPYPFGIHYITTATHTIPQGEVETTVYKVGIGFPGLLRDGPSMVEFSPEVGIVSFYNEDGMFMLKE